MPDQTETVLHLPSGLPGSGRRRYAAAMAHHARGELSDAALEVFRVLAARDRDDPAPLLAGENLPAPDPSGAEAALEGLRQDLLTLLHQLRGPGIAETRAVMSSAGTQQIVAGPGPTPEAWLHPALAALAPLAPSLARAIAMAAAHLAWRRYAYPEREIGPHFPDGHAFAPLVGGTDAPFPRPGTEVGLFLMAPGLFYRDHAHPAPELYLPLTGPHSWRFVPDAPFAAKAALVPVWNDPDRPHAIKVGPVPFLALYAWLDHVEAPSRVLPAKDWAIHEDSA